MRESQKSVAFLPNYEKRKFDVSKNKGTKTSRDECNNLIEHMNNNFDYYSKINEKGEIYNKLKCPNDLMIDFVKKNLSKKSSLIIYSRFTDNFCEERPLVVSEISKLDLIFDITGIYRSKRSGTSEPPKKDFTELKEYFEDQGHKCINEYIDKKRRTLVHDPEGRLLEYKEYPPEKEKMMFLAKASEKKTDYREVKKRSGTNNPGVIFTLTPKNNQSHYDLAIIESIIDKKVY